MVGATTGLQPVSWVMAAAMAVPEATGNMARYGGTRAALAAQVVTPALEALGVLPKMFGSVLLALAAVAAEAVAAVAVTARDTVAA
jgi:hypothetical protein